MTDASRKGWMSSTAVHVAFGFLSMGAWAVFANRNHPLGDAALAGVVQGAISGALTLVLKKFLEWLSVRFSGGRQPELAEGGFSRIAALAVPPLITATSIFLILFSAHTLAGTPEVAATIAVPFTVSTTYAIVYNLGLWRETHGRR